MQTMPAALLPGGISARWRPSHPRCWICSLGNTCMTCAKALLCNKLNGANQVSTSWFSQCLNSSDVSGTSPGKV